MTHQILGISNDTYELNILNIWFVWCSKHSSTQIQLQRLMTSPGLFNWWKQQYKKYETEFLEDAKPYDLTQSDALNLYMRSVQKIHFIYSKPLIQKALKNDQTAKN